MSTAYEIPFEAKAQTFLITLSGTTYRLTTAWNDSASCWMLDISLSDDTPIIRSLPIVTGVDLLSQLGYLGITGKIYVQSAGNPSATPGYADLGVTGLVFYVVP